MNDTLEKCSTLVAKVKIVSEELAVGFAEWPKRSDGTFDTISLKLEGVLLRGIDYQEVLDTQKTRVVCFVDFVDEYEFGETDKYIGLISQFNSGAEDEKQITKLTFSLLKCHYPHFARMAGRDIIIETVHYKIPESVDNKSTDEPVARLKRIALKLSYTPSLP